MFIYVYTYICKWICLNMKICTHNVCIGLFSSISLWRSRCMSTFIYIYIYIYLCVYILVHTYIHIYVFIYMYTYTYTFMPIGLFPIVSLWRSRCMSTFMCIYIYIYIFMCLYISTYIHIYTYMYSYICIHTRIRLCL
jgi:hypothetical protein